MNLTREQIENMPAGREMDALVAEYVMGGFVKDPEEWSKENENWYWMHPKSGVLVGRPYMLPQITKEAIGMYSHQYEAWKPSEDISAAWEVVETFDRVFWDISISSLTDDDGEIWEASFHEYFPDSSGRHGKALALTTPLAICRAALIAVLEAR